MKWIKKVAATPLTTIARVVDSLQEQTNDRTNAPSIHAVKEAINNNWLTIYPIGSIYLTVDPTFDPSVTFGGTWEQIKDRFLLASGDTYTSGNTGGEATHTLNTNEIPSHKHQATHNIYRGGSLLIKNTAIGSDNPFYMLDAEPTEEALDTQNTGGGQAHNNMPPYLVVNVWKRTA